MAGIKLVPIIPKNSPFNRDISGFADALEKLLDDEADEVKKDFEKTTSTWETKVNFTINKTKFGRGISTKSKIYGYVNNGTRAHTITARRARVLAFGSASRPKTRPGVIASSNGGSGGSTVYRRQVRHPGTTAREFDKAIYAKSQKRFGPKSRRTLKQYFG
jgi:hypothetical protein